MGHVEARWGGGGGGKGGLTSLDVGDAMVSMSPRKISQYPEKDSPKQNVVGLSLVAQHWPSLIGGPTTQPSPVAPTPLDKLLVFFFGFLSDGAGRL